MSIKPSAALLSFALLLLAPRLSSEPEEKTAKKEPPAFSEADKEWAKPWDVVFDYDVPPKPIKITRPRYPTEAFMRNIEGTVVLEMVIDPEGSVARVRVLKSVAGLDDAALQCATAWKFTPALKNGQPVATMARAPMGFRIFTGPTEPADTRLGSLTFDSGGADFTSWHRRFKTQIHDHWSQPRVAKDKHGHVDLEFIVERDGRVSEIRILSASSLPDFDKAAVKALRTSHLDALPTDYPSPSVTMHVSFSFNEGEPEPAKP